MQAYKIHSGIFGRNFASEEWILGDLATVGRQLDLRARCYSEVYLFLCHLAKLNGALAKRAVMRGKAEALLKEEKLFLSFF